jgi:hypothetical protein
MSNSAGGLRLIKILESSPLESIDSETDSCIYVSREDIGNILVIRIIATLASFNVISL